MSPAASWEKAAASWSEGVGMPLRVAEEEVREGWRPKQS